MDDVEDIIAAIGELATEDECRRVCTAAVERQRAVYELERRKAAMARWERLLRCKAGDVLYVGCDGKLFLFGDDHAGDTYEIVAYDDPRKRDLLWLKRLTKNGKKSRARTFRGWSPDLAHRMQLGTKAEWDRRPR